jgi:hypothetical protein
VLVRAAAAAQVQVDGLAPEIPEMLATPVTPDHQQHTLVNL